jgi:hypothetical protein
MERILEKVEALVEKQIADFEKNPISTSVRLFIFYWIFKQVWKEIKR